MKKAVLGSLLSICAAVGAGTFYAIGLTSVEFGEAQLGLENHLRSQFSAKRLCSALSREIVVQRLISSSPAEVRFKSYLLYPFVYGRGAAYCTRGLIEMTRSEHSNARECLRKADPEDFKHKTSCMLRIPLWELQDTP